MARGSRSEHEAAIRSKSRKLDADLRNNRRKFKRFGRDSARSITGAFAGVRRNLSGILGFGAAGTLAVVGNQVRDFEKGLIRLAIQSGKSNDELADYRKEIDRVSKSTGVSREEILTAVDAFTNLDGEIGPAQESVALLARAMQASGASGEDLAGVLLALKNNLDVAPDEFEKRLANIIEIGKTGSIPLKNLAVALQRTAGRFRKFNGEGEAGAAVVASLLQTLRAGGFSSAEEASTGLTAAFTQLEKKSDDIQKKLKVTVKTAEGFRNFRDIIDDLAARDLKPGQLLDVIGESNAAAAIETLVRERQRTAAFVAAANAETAQSFDADLQRVAESPAGRIDAALNAFKVRLAEAFTPERIEKFATLLEKLVRLLEFAADNFEEIVATVAGGKLAGFAKTLSTIGAGLSGGGGALAGLGAVGSAIGSVLGVGGAGLAGFGVGTLLDNAFGLSDLLSGTSDSQSQADRERAAGFPGAAKNVVEELSFGRGANDRGAVQRAILFGRESGLIDRGGRVLDTNSGDFQERAREIGVRPTLELVNALKIALANQERLGLDVRIAIDDPGILSVSTRESRSSRR